MRVYEHVKALPSVGIGNSLPKKICITALAFVTVIACATSASAQSVPDRADSIGASAPPTASFGAAIQAQNPLSPVYSLLNENSTNFEMGPLERTQSRRARAAFKARRRLAALSATGSVRRPAHVPPVA
jgi:hypothetical protein